MTSDTTGHAMSMLQTSPFSDYASNPKPQHRGHGVFIQIAMSGRVVLIVQRNPEKACVGVIMNFYG